MPTVSKIAARLLALKDFVLKQADPVLLLFLLLVCNYRFSFKIAAVVAIYIYRPNFKFSKAGIIYFYASIIVLSLFNLLVISGNLAYSHVIIVLAGCLIWLGCLLVFHQVNLSIQKNTSQKTINTLKLLTIANLLMSLFDLAKVMRATHSLNPYNQISPPPYGISSGDLIGGIFGDMHLVNMSICAMLFVFFMYRQQFLFALLALIPFLLTGSNLGTLIVIAALAYMALPGKQKLIRQYYVLFSLAFVMVFYVKVTPRNFEYLGKTFAKIGAQLSGKHVVTVKKDPVIEPEKSAEEIKKEKIQQYLQARYGKESEAQRDSVYNLKQAYVQHSKAEKVIATIHTLHVKDSIQLAKSQDPKFDYGHLKTFDFNKRSGKLISFDQTKTFMQSSWQHAVFGAGIGGFSSRLAFIGSEIIGDSRILMAMPKYEDPNFTNNHKAIFKYLLFLEDEYHSVTNLPFCWYNELLGEYGLLGFLLFALLYMGFFARRFKLLSYGKLLLAMMLLFFLFDYWYERVSVMVLFELLMLLDIKLGTEEKRSQITQP